MKVPKTTELEKFDIAARRVEWLSRQRDDALVAAEASQAAGQAERAEHYLQQAKNLVARLEEETTPGGYPAGSE